MPAATSHLNRNEIIRSFTLTALIIIMDMSGFAGLAAEERLEEEPADFNTLSSLNMPGFQKGLASIPAGARHLALACDARLSRRCR